MNNDVFTIEHTYNAPIEKVWKAISDKNEMKKWYFDLREFKTEVGFEFRFTGGPSPDRQYLHICVITEVIPNKKLTYSWRFDGYPGNSFVTFELFTENARPDELFGRVKTKLKFTHAGIESFAVSKNPDLDAKNFPEGWNHIIGTALKKFVE